VQVSWANRGNSAEAWEGAFAPGGHWDEIGGDALTECFGRCILENLNPEVTEYLETARRWVLDWGCARGQTTALLRERFPRAHVAGMDFARGAINQAVEQYGGHFIYEPTCRIRTRWDVIVNSNVLEHLPDPIGVVREHLSHPNAYYIILVPYEEDLNEGNDMTVEQRRAAGYGHVQRFGMADFPDEIGGARCIQRDMVEPGPAWPGQQLLLAYKT
jgi:SAM-dependent methyltransferase